MKSVLKWLGRIFSSRWLPWSLLTIGAMLFFVLFAVGELAIPRLLVTRAQRSAALRLYSEHNLEFAEYIRGNDQRVQWTILRNQVLVAQHSRQHIGELLNHLRSEFRRLESSEVGRKIANNDSLLHKYVRLRDSVDVTDHELESLDRILKDGLLVCDLSIADPSLSIGTEKMEEFVGKLKQIAEFENRLDADKVLLGKFESSAFYKPADRDLGEFVEEVHRKGFEPYVDSVEKNLLNPAEEARLKNLDRERERVGQNLMYSCSKSFEANEIIRVAFARFDDANYQAEEKAKSQSSGQ